MLHLFHIYLYLNNHIIYLIKRILFKLSELELHIHSYLIHVLYRKHFLYLNSLNNIFKLFNQYPYSQSEVIAHC